MSGEGKDLWLFFFTDHLPDVIENFTEGLQGMCGYLYTCTCTCTCTIFI
jgi:hypothetical protein